MARQELLIRPASGRTGVFGFGKPRSEVAILVVEDEKIVAHDIARVLGDMGYWVMGTAKSCEETLCLAGQQRPDLVLMDVNLKGGEDGIAAARRLRERFDVPVVFLTAYADDEILARARGCEPLGYLVKPVKETDLKAAVEVALYRHEADRRVRARERWFATTLRSVGDAVVAVDPELAVTFVNAEAERLLGHAAGELTGRPLAEIVRLRHARTHVPAENPVERALRERTTDAPSTAFLLDGADGRSSAVEASAAPIITESAELLGAVLVLRDVEYRRRLEERIVLADRLVALGTLAAGIAHEINNPLALITNNTHFVALELAELARDLGVGTLPPAEGVRRIAEMEAALRDVAIGAQRAAAIIEEMRRFSAHEPAAREPVDVGATLAWAVRMSSAQIAARAALETDLPALPKTLANRTRIAQVFMNVLSNAVEALPSGEPGAHRVRVSARSAGSEIVVEVSDTGRGMSREVRQRVFDPFFTTKGVGAGSGLGLAVAHGIVTDLGGHIEIDSTEQQGTTVRIVLPVVTL